MLDIKFIRDNPELVKQNIRNKFQEEKLPLVDEVIELYARQLEAKQAAEALQANRNALSKQIGMLKAQAKKNPSEAEACEAEATKIQEQVVREAEEREALEHRSDELAVRVRELQMKIPNIIDPSVPLGPDESCNVEVSRFGEPAVPDFEIPYHADIMAAFNGLDLSSGRRVSGNGFYYLVGDVARLHEAVLAYARDFMIGKGFVYVIPPFMMRGEMARGVMSQGDMDAMMYRIDDGEGADPDQSLYLIGTSEHTMIARFAGQILPEESLPLTYTSYSPCFRKEKGAHGLEERGIYRIHQFEKQEMIVICRPEESMAWYDKLWQYSVELFRALDIPVRQLECCSGDLADLKVKSCDIEAWSPRRKSYFEVCSCSNLGDAQARRLGIRVKEKFEGTDKKGKTVTKTRTVLPHTLNNTCVAPPRMLIALLENNLQRDGSVRIPEALRPYMGGEETLKKVKSYIPPQD